MDKHRNVADYNSEKSTVSLRQYIESLIAELSKRLDAQFQSAEKAVGTALAAQEKALNAALASADKLTAAAFVAAKEALAEAQTQLVAYKAASNEWRSTLTDLIAKIVTRQEIESLFTSVNKDISELAKRIALLEGQGQRIQGKDESKSEIGTLLRWLIGLAVVIVLGLLGYFVAHK